MFPVVSVTWRLLVLVIGRMSGITKGVERIRNSSVSHSISRFMNAYYITVNRLMEVI